MGLRQREIRYHGGGRTHAVRLEPTEHATSARHRDEAFQTPCGIRLPAGSRVHTGGRVDCAECRRREAALQPGGMEEGREEGAMAGRWLQAEPEVLRKRMERAVKRLAHASRPLGRREREVLEVLTDGQVAEGEVR